jgi:hypothetical protein
MSALYITSIVEGHGEVKAVPILIRRVVEQVDATLLVQTPMPIRVPRSKLVKDGEIERHVELAAGKIQERGGILVLVDADEDCPRELGPSLLKRARRARADVPVAVVLAKREFEAWFLAAAASIAGKRRLAGDLTPPADPESITGAKGWLTARMPRSHPYHETTDQAALTACFDLALARRASSFDKCYRDIERLVREAQSLTKSGSARG